MKRRHVILAIFILCSISCSKVKNTTCSGSFLAYSVMSAGGASGTTFQLIGMNATTGQQVAGRIGDLELSDPYYKGVYNVAQNSYYVYAANINAIQGYLYKIDFSGGGVAQFPHTAADSAGNWALLCNSKTGKLYNITNGWGPVETIYEVITAPVFSETKIFTTDSGTLHSPVIDENSGYIFFVSWPYLKKIDPASGTASIVTTYTNVLPDQLQYDNKDGMFYGVNIFTRPYTFIRINPKNGDVTTLADLSFFTDNPSHTFDYCDNLYILYGQTNLSTYWIDPETGKVEKNVGVSSVWDLTYINHVF